MTFSWPAGELGEIEGQMRSPWSTLILIICQVQLNSNKKYFDIKLDQIDSIMYHFKITWGQDRLPRLPCHMTHTWLITWWFFSCGKHTWSGTCRLWWTKRCSLRLSFGIRIIKIFTSIWWLNDWFIFKKIYFFLLLSSGLPEQKNETKIEKKN